jgi:adenine deaminase
MTELQAVALGEATADLVVRGGRVCLLERREFQSRDVAIVDNEIAAIPRDASDVVGEETTVVHADDRVVLPGFIDAHTHLDIHQTVENAYHYLLEGGTTTMITEVSALGGAFGATGIEALLTASSYLPVTVLATVPPQPLLDTFEPAWADEEETQALVELLDDDRVVGVGETDWIHIVGQKPAAGALYDRASELGKPIAGHGAGCTGRKLDAFAGVVDNDHEAISGDGIEERLENGLHVIGRSGSIRNDLDALATAVDRVGAADCSLSTDGIWPTELIDDRAMDAVIRGTIEAGVDPIDAIRMATLNPARHFGLHDRGSIAPGNVADLVLVDDLETMNVTTVVSDGELVVQHSEPLVAPRTTEYPEELYDAVHVSIDPKAVEVPADVAAADGQVRAVEYDHGLLSRATTVEPPQNEGQLVPSADADIAKATLWNRRPDCDDVFTGFLTGLGIEQGAIATTVTWETPGLLAIGTTDEALLEAARQVVELGGGWVVRRDGEAISELPMRVGAVCSDLEVEETAKLYAATGSACRTIGCTVDRPLLAVQTLTFPGVPTLKFGFTGYRDVLNRDVLGLTP